MSDFNRHLQARDIVRFLKFSTENLPGSASEYLDRFIVPAEIRQAIPKCSKEKLANGDEIHISDFGEAYEYVRRREKTAAVIG